MKRVWPILLLVLLLTGCGESSEQPGTTNPIQKPRTEAPTTRPGPETTQARATTTETTSATTVSGSKSAPAYGYTYGQASGNRVVEGTGRLPESEPVEVQLDGVPVWVVGVPLEDDTAWVATLEGGGVQAFRLDKSGQASPVSISPNRIAPGEPPLVKADGGKLSLVTTGDPRASRLTHPVPVGPGSKDLLGIEQDGRVSVGRPEADVSAEKLPVVALPDARIVRSSNGTLATLSDPTLRYEHGVLGDAVEANSMTSIRPRGDAGFESGSIAPASGGVFEQIAPFWFEIPGMDGELLAVTESTTEVATRVSVYSPDGKLAAAGPFIGEPFKWRHLIAAGPFGPNGEMELVDTLTPHIGGTIEFYKPNFDNGSLDIVATRTGYTSHRIYTRNMDTARAGDLDGDGRWELLVPNDAYTELGAIRHEQNGARVAWTLPADGTIVTNLASATNSEGQAQIAAGRQDGVLRIWP